MKPLIVYLSSTYDDLQPHRSHLAQELRRKGFEPIGLEDPNATQARSLRRRLEDVGRCHLFVGIVAWSYGEIPLSEECADLSLPPHTQPGVTSFTEYEYRQALATNKQVFMFLLDPQKEWPPAKMDARDATGDNGKAIDTWREELRRTGLNGHSVPLFTDQFDLASRAVQLLSPYLPAEQPAIVNEAASPARHNLPPLTYSEPLDRQDQLNQIQAGLAKNAPLICLEGEAGMGKTRLAILVGNDYLRQPAEELAGRYVVWLDASTEAGRGATLDDMLNLIARVASYQQLTQDSSRKKKKRQIRELLAGKNFLLIVDDFDELENLELMQWLVDTKLPSHALLVMRHAPPQAEIPPCPHVVLQALNQSETLDYLHSQASSLDISELKHPAALEVVQGLVDYTKGNPRLAELAIGTLKGRLDATGPDRQLDKAVESIIQPDGLLAEKMEALYRLGWQDLPPKARVVLRCLPLFGDSPLIMREALLATSGLEKTDFDTAQKQLLERLLLKQDTKTGNYVVEADTRDFAQQELRREPEFEVAARRRWSEFYLAFVQQHVERDEPDSLYWRSLVSTSMKELTPEWPAIMDVLRWADLHRKDQMLLKLVLLLMHYMDSRFLNRERLQFADKGVLAARRLRQPYEEALLRIDALGWTYFEEDCPLKAYDEIARGLALVRPLVATSQDVWELRRLGLAWQARVKMEISLSERSTRYERDILREEAIELIEEALCANCSPWIRYRILKAAGDIALKADLLLQQDGQPTDALALYLQAEAEIAKYGGEGGSYQIAPRVGLAYLRKWLDSFGTGEPESKYLDQAETYFGQLSTAYNPHIPLVGELYGKYGQALIERYRGHEPEANQKLKQLQEELQRYSLTNQLLKLVTSFTKTRPTPLKAAQSGS